MANRARTRCPYSPFATCYSLKLIVAALEPIFEIDERRGAFVIARTLERAVIDRLHPGFVGAGAVAAENEPHQPARRLPRHDLSLEKHVAQGDLGATLALGRGQLEPARCLMRVAWCRGEVETTEFVLRVGVAEIGRGVAEHVAGAGAVRRDLRIRYAGQIIMPERDEGVGDEAGLRRARCFVWMAVGDLAEIAERAQVIARYASATGCPCSAAYCNAVSAFVVPGALSGGCALPRKPSAGDSAAVLGVVVPSNAKAGAVPNTRSIRLRARSGTLARQRPSTSAADTAPSIKRAMWLDIRIARRLSRSARMRQRSITRRSDLLSVFPQITGSEFGRARLPFFGTPIQFSFAELDVQRAALGIQRDDVAVA